MSKLIIVDGNSIANRAFYALPLLSNAEGLHTNAVYGVTTMLLKLLEEEKPTHFLFAFDAGKVTFRHADYKEYKAGRAKTPPELSEQWPLIKELVAAFNIQQFELEGYEADDIIGTLTRMADEEKMETLVVTGDKDMLQLASEHVKIALTIRRGISEMEVYGPEQIQEKYGLKPLQIIDMKGLMGDASDNIPGVPGIGEKTALKLLHEYGSVENVLEHAPSIKGKMGERLVAHAEDARLSKELATIYREVPLSLTWDDLKFEGIDEERTAALFKRLEFKSLLERLNLSASAQVSEQTLEIPVQIVQEQDLSALLGKLDEVRAVHVEVLGDNPHHGEVLGIAFAFEASAMYVGFETLMSEEGRPLREWLEDEGTAKTIYDAHRVHLALAWQGIKLRGTAFDVHLAAYVLDPSQSNQSLGDLMRRFGLPTLPEDEEIFGKGAKFRIPELEVYSSYLGRKAYAISQLRQPMHDELEKTGMNELYYDLELKLSRVLAEMELTGIKVKSEELERFGEELKERIREIEQEIYDLAGTEFNIGSPKQLGEILFEKLNLPVIKKTKTGYSTDVEVLERLAPYHEIAAKVVEYRQLTKLQSTYVEGLLKEIRPETGKIHTYYRQTIAATGRLSSQYPNLQNIPIRLEEGRLIRRAFVPSEEGWYILAADYSQIELRVLAHISQDERLMEAFRQNMDIHTKTAMDVFGVAADEVDANMRRQAKAVNFGIVYGISDYGLSQNLHIPRKEAAAFIEAYFNVFQGVRRYMDEIVKSAKQDGYVSTLLNRRRYLPEINASNYNRRSFAERTAMNTPIQGTAADIIKLAMVKLAERMTDEGLRSRMLLQVHDELVFEVPPEELEVMKQLVPEVMENAIALDVPLKAEVSWGTDWYEAK
ncbi:DNA polymerase I [Insulibacter thermoxylanivorax]|uniref:DNA polymerase I n=1 Tax=Insulibacter thermoxylanivorax TaxID=2749268 RepID=A0A916QGL9_9BACL|nr:DNA polymerase I [Insulibacter thermoxylanivorax]GFR38067.1 DNA polymerase I [Insulibacter thermoxylanivorax]